MNWNTVWLTAGLTLAIPMEAAAASEPQGFYDYFESFCSLKKCRPHKASKVVRDDKNGYVQIKNEQEYGTQITTFVMWVTSDKTRLFGYTAEYAGYTGTSYRVSFWSYDEGKWAEATAATPVIGLKDFWGEDRPLPEKKYQRIQLEYVLPRRGTTIVVYPRIYDEPGDVAEVSKDQSFDEAEYKELIESRKFQAIELVWDAKTGRLSKGRQLPKKR
jgi:hypothetical protein